MMLLLLWKYFHYQPLAVSFLQEFAKDYNENQPLPVCPSTTRWTSHGKACKALYECYQAQLGALTVCFNERKELEALGMFMAITSEIFIASYIYIVYKAIAPLNLVLQTGIKQLCLTDVKTYIHITRSKLKIWGLVKGSGSRRKILMIWSQGATANIKSPYKCKTLICWYKFWMGILCHLCLQEGSVSSCSAVRQCIWTARILDGFTHFGST